MSLTADVEMDMMFPNIGFVIPGKVATADTYYKGAMVNVLDSAGLILVAADTVDHIFMGFVKEQVVLASGTKDIEIICGTVAWLVFGSANQDDVGNPVYATADDTIAMSASNTEPMGMCVAFKTGYLLVDTRIRSVDV